MSIGLSWGDGGAGGRVLTGGASGGMWGAGQGQQVDFVAGGGDMRQKKTC